MTYVNVEEDPSGMMRRLLTDLSRAVRGLTAGWVAETALLRAIDAIGASAYDWRNINRVRSAVSNVHTLLEQTRMPADKASHLRELSTAIEEELEIYECAARLLQCANSGIT
jgi:hypothetical protein